VPAHERTPARRARVVDPRQVHLSERAEIEPGALGLDIASETPDKPWEQEKIPRDAVGAGVSSQVFAPEDRRRTGNISVGSPGDSRNSRMSLPTNSGFSSTTACELPGTTAS
jgi:hypothetical protein